MYKRQDAIRTLKQIESENRLATPEEQKTLSKFVGWGGLSQDVYKRQVQEQDFSQIVNIKDEEIIYRLGSIVCDVSCSVLR